MDNSLQPKSHRIVDIIDWGREMLSRHDILHARYNVEVMLENILRKRRVDLYLDYDYRLSSAELDLLKEYMKKRLGRWPLWQLVGTVEFFGLELRVNEHVLIPRPETELLVDLALKELASREGTAVRYVADIGTGSGNISVALAKSCSDLFIYAVDISGEALAVAEANAGANGVDGSISFIKGNLLSSLGDRGYACLDMIVSNPPYVSEGEWANLPSEVKDREPRVALHGGEDGLEIIRQLVRQAPLFLKANGCLFLEVGRGQAAAVKRMIDTTGYYDSSEMYMDYSGIERVLSARRNEKP